MQVDFSQQVRKPRIRAQTIPLGMIADRTTTRWGKFRPWLLWTSVPFGIISILTFTTPRFSPGAKIFNARITYILLRVIYTVNNVPYASLTAVMTQDSGVFSMALNVISPHATYVIIVTEVLRQFSFGLSGPILWAMMGDVADYREWKTRRRATGAVTGGIVFALWSGLALGGAVAGWLPSVYELVSKADVQTVHTQTGIALTASIYAGLFFFAAATCLFFYLLTREKNQSIASELAGRRKKAPAVAGAQ